MGTLHLFGDSFTEGHNLDTSFVWYKVWKELKGGNLPLTWHEILSQKLGMKTNVKAIGGSSNNETFHTICKNCDSFKKNDIVIINWSYLHRFRWASTFYNNDGVEVIDPMTGEPLNMWVRMGITVSNHHKYVINESTQMEIAINQSTHPYHVELIYDYEKIIDNLCKNIGCKVYYWSMDEKIINSLPKDKLNQKKYICNQYVGNYEIKLSEIDIGHHYTLFREIYKRGGLNIKDETNRELPDTHLGESGHKIQADLFYEYLINIDNSLNIQMPTKKLI